MHNLICITLCLLLFFCRRGSPHDVNFKRVRLRLKSKWVGKIAIKTQKKRRIHFLSEVFPALTSISYRIFNSILEAYSKIRKPRRLFRLSTSNFRLSTSDFWFPTSNFRRGGDRPTRLLPYAKMLLVPKTFFPLLLGRLCSRRFWLLLFYAMKPPSLHWEVIAHISILF